MGLPQIFRRVFGAKPRVPSIPPDLVLTRLQDHLDATCGGAAIGCNYCSSFIVPVVNPRPSSYEVVALACCSCHAIYDLDEPGRLELPTVH